MSKKNKFQLLSTTNGHWYFILNEDFPDGQNMPSVTNILECYPNPGIKFWLENTSPEEIKLKQEDGKTQGSKVHHCCFLLSTGEKIDPDVGLTKEQVQKLPLETSDDKTKDVELLNYLMKPLTDREHRAMIGFQNYWEEFNPITIAKEIQVYNKDLLYAGTLDWVGYLWNKKLKKYELWIIDYKISNQHSKAYESQVVSYHKALQKMKGRNFRARLGILYIGKSTKKRFQLKEIDDSKGAWEDFIYTKKLWHSIYKGAKPIEQEKREVIYVDTSFKRKGRIIKF